MIFRDLREYISEVEKIGEYKQVEGVDWNLELGFITEWQASLRGSPLLIFDNIKGYPKGYRVAANLFSTPKRTALALGLPGEISRIQLISAIKEKLARIEPLPPVQIQTGPVKENILRGDQIDMFKFPIPKWHPKDGGRYFGTGCVVITRDPDTGWVGASTYRVQAQGKNFVTILMLPGRHGRMMMEKWWAKGLKAPVAIATGFDPILFAMGTYEVPHGIGEYEYAGSFRGKPVEVTSGETVDLPIPACAEIVLEGEIAEGDNMNEGPFGEYTGYYGGGISQCPVVRLKAILHRDNPIIHGAPPLMRPSSWSLAHPERRAANAWNYIDKLVPGIKGVYMPDYAQFSPVVISLEQKYVGHAKQAAMAALAAPPTSFIQPFIILVDDDIDPSNWDEVWWAITTRCDPETAIDIVRGMRSTNLHPAMPPNRKLSGDYTLATAVINACRPYHLRGDYPPTIKSNPKELEATIQKWGDYFK